MQLALWLFSSLPAEILTSSKPASGVDVSMEKLDELAAGALSGSAYEQVCAACHGAKGQGNEELKSSSIAGLSAWYIEEKLA